MKQSPGAAFSPWGQSTNDGLKFTHLDVPKHKPSGIHSGPKDDKTGPEDRNELFDYVTRSSRHDLDGLVEARRREAAEYVLEEDRQLYSQLHEREMTDVYSNEKKEALVRNTPLGHTAKLSHGLGKASCEMIKTIDDEKK